VNGPHTFYASLTLRAQSPVFLHTSAPAHPDDIHSIIGKRTSPEHPAEDDGNTQVRAVSLLAHVFFFERFIQVCIHTMFFSAQAAACHSA
jgi:hypothetical protein